MTQSVPTWRQPVIQVPLTQAFKELGEVQEFRSKICLFNHDRTKVFDVVSPRYQLIEHSKAVDTITEAICHYFDLPDIEPSVRSFDGGAVINATYKLPIAPVKIGRGDVSDLTLDVRNSYNRTQVFQANLGAFRLICSNGMKIGEGFGGIRCQHVGDGSSQDAILEELDTMVRSAPKLKDLWSEWMDTRVSEEEARELLGGKFPDKYLTPVLAKKWPRSKWELYNDLTYFSTHQTPTVRRRLEFDDTIASLFY